MEQSLEFQTPLLVNFTDFKKTFDSVHRESLWEVAKLCGIPEKYIRIFKEGIVSELQMLRRDVKRKHHDV